MRDKKIIKSDYLSLFSMTDKRKRGFEFERLINELLESETLHPSYSFRPKGEQVDGMFEFNNSFFHLECKWEEKPISASDVYSFILKYQGKLQGTLGVDFSIDAPETIQNGKVINVLLFTKQDIDWCFHEEHCFANVLKAKLRYAALHGSVLYEYEQHLQLLKSNKSK